MANDRQVKLSKFLSLVLRHEPAKAGITLDEAGWCDVDQLLEGCKRAGKSMTRQELEELVRSSDKQRYALSDDGQRIRANQGHSVQVDLGYEPAQPPDTLYHGTADRNVESIKRDGLQKGSRHHVHLSPDPETAFKVGQRHGRPVVLLIDCAAMVRDGHTFYVSANGVWLTESVPGHYIREKQ